MDTVVSGTVPWNIRKVILLGKEGVGKTTLSRCLGKKNGKIDCTKKYIYFTVLNNLIP